MKPKSAQDLMRDNMLVKHYAGSLAYGTNLPESDVDFRGIFCADPVNVRTPFFPVREASDNEEEDTKLYELAHFMKLCTDCNPNIIETLWVDDSDIVYRTNAYQLLRDNREKLLSSKVAFTFSGYALSQLKRIKGHNKWINNPQPKEPPRQIDFISLVQWFGVQKRFKINLEEFHKDYRLVPYGGDIYGLYDWKGYETFDKLYTLNTQWDGDLITLERPSITLNPETFEPQTTINPATDKPYTTRHTPLAVLKWNKNEYKLAKEKHQQYWTWKENRNEKRGELEEQFGYDTKHAMHLVRLLRMGVEILKHHEVIVKRPDAQELLDIRNGAWKYEDVVAYAEDMDKQVREVWYKTTSLPKKPNIKFAAELLMDVQDLVWSKND